MLERLNDPSGPLFDVSGGEVVASETLAAHLADREQPRHALLSDSIDHETQGRTTTVKPEGGHDAYLIATDERLLVILGDQPETVEIEFDLLSISRCNLKSGFLSTTLVVGHSDERIRFSPTDGDAETVTDYISQMADVYRSVESSLGSAMETLETLESRIREDGTEGDYYLRVQSQISEARHHATREDDVPEDRLLERIAQTNSEFDQRYASAWIDRAETELETAETAIEADDFEEFCAAFSTAVEAVSSVQETLDDLDSPPETDTAVGTLTDRAEELKTTYLQAIPATQERATDADDAASAADAWLESYRRLAALEQSEWEPTLESRALPVSDTESVAAKAVDALEAHAEELESAGEVALDEDAQQARDRFERAAERLRQAQEIAAAWESIEGADYETRLADIEEQIEVTEWEWGAG